MINQIKISNVIRLASYILLIGLFLLSCKSTAVNVDTSLAPSSLLPTNKYNLLELDAFGNTYLLTNKKRTSKV